MVSNGHPHKRVAFLIENGFEDSEFQVPYKALQLAGVETVVLGSRLNETYKGKQGKVSIQADATTTETRPGGFDAIVIPGGMAPDTMRNNPNTVQFVKDAIDQGKLVAAVCHGPQVLIDADVLRGRQATGFVSIRQDMINAGANYIDEPLVIDGNLITSRQPGDLAIFSTAILTRLGLAGKDAELPAETEAGAEWWKLADAWGGSTKKEIVSGLNTALAGERYGQEAFSHYVDKASDPELRSLLQQILESKRQHIQILESRLNAFNESPSLPAKAADTLAKLKTSLQSSQDEDVLRRALGDIQTGVVDTYNLRKQFTDPISTRIFTQIESELAEDEQRLAAFYHAHYGSEAVKPAQPTTGAAL